MSVEAEFVHEDEYEEFSDEILFFAEALGTENIFHQSQNVPEGNIAKLITHL